MALVEFSDKIISLCYRHHILFSIRVSARLHRVRARIEKISAAFPDGEGPEVVENTERKLRNISNPSPNAPCTRNLRSRTKGGELNSDDQIFREMSSLFPQPFLL